ncbi:MAG: SpoIIE family protein phosphatase [Spirochaetes bacterium]|nr:SpoIIE family protein phosphatase [Spirochaetota bacterium]MBN2770870.1 SpoIIE family protein phosphatase [Spirochaetota bacterium]
MKKSILILLFILFSCGGYDSAIFDIASGSIHISESDLESRKLISHITYVKDRYIRELPDEKSIITRSFVQKEVNCDTIEQLEPGTYIFTLSIPESAGITVFRSPFFNTSCNVFIDKRLLGSFTERNIHHPQKRAVTIPSAGTVTIAIHLYGKMSESDFEPFSIESLTLTQQKSIRYILLSVMIILLLLANSFSHIKNLKIQKREVQLLFSAIAPILAALQIALVTGFFMEISIPNTVFLRLYYPIGALSIICLIISLYHINLSAIDKKLIIIASIVFFFITLVLMIPPIVSLVYIIPTIYSILLVILIIAAVAVIKTNVFDNKRLSLLFALSLIFLSAAAIIDSFAPLYLYHARYVYQVTLLLFMIILISPAHKKLTGCFASEQKLTQELAIKSAKLVKANFELKVLNQNLEETVNIRTNEYKNALSSVEATLRELEKAHASIEHDLVMASNVQRLYFSEKIPRVKGWEIAFIYNPMHQVSGDMYDFYVSNNILLGATLFDVSGHGVQSALITMLAKNLISELYYKLYEKPAGSILEIINKRLIEEIGSIENYMTGILMKIKGNSIEVANASHANILHRSHSGNTVRELSPKQSKGSFLGIGIMDEPYGTDTYLIEEDDSLLLYSDGLYEYRHDGVLLTREFDLIKDNLMKCKKHQSAQSQLDQILKSLSISNRKALGDDLTVILLKRVQD